MMMICLNVTYPQWPLYLLTFKLQFCILFASLNSNSKSIFSSMLNDATTLWHIYSIPYRVQIKKGLDDTTPQDALKPWYLESTGAITPSSETVWLFQIMGVLPVCAIHLKHRSFTFYCKLSIWVESHCGSRFSLNVMRPVVILSYDIFKLSRVLLRDTFMIAPG